MEEQAPAAEAVEVQTPEQPQLEVVETQPEVQAEAQAEEPAAAEPTPEPVDLESVKRFRALAKREREIRGREQALKERESATPQRSPYDDIQMLARTDPLKAMKALGINYDELTHQVINDGNITGEMKLERENAALRERLDKIENQFSDRVTQDETQRYEQAYGSFIDEIKGFVKNSDSYELVSKTDAYQDVARVMQGHYNDTGEVMSYADAAREVERSLEAIADRYLGTKKIEDRYRAKWAPSAQPDQPAEQAEPESQTPNRPKTLTNELAHGRSESNTKMLSRDESLELIARKLREGAY